MRSSHFVSTVAKARDCRHCHQSILSALDEGSLVYVDPYPIDDELSLLMSGVRTFTRLMNGELCERTAERLRGGFLRGEIHREHDCGGTRRLARLRCRAA